jgi:Pectate lyase superfamily protein
MPNKSIPTIGDSNWGTPLNAHLSQLQNPATGGINTFEQFSGRPTNLTADDVGKTYLYTQTGNLHQWTGTIWKVLNESVINVKDYGAVGDGVVDDTGAVQSAINQVTLVKKTTTVQIPQGEYKVTGGIIVPRDVKIKGSGKQLTKISHSANNVCFDNLTQDPHTYTGTEFSDFTLYHTYTGNAFAIGILTGNSSAGVKFENLNIQGFNGGVGIELRNTNTWTESSIWQNVVMIENKVGIKLTRTTDSASFPNAAAYQETISFGYTNMKEVLFAVAAGQTGMLVGAGCYLYNSHISLRGSQAAGSTLVKVLGNLEYNYYEIVSEGYNINDGSYLFDVDTGHVSGTGYIQDRPNKIINGGYISTYVGSFGGNVGVGVENPQSQLDVVGKNGITVGGYNTLGVVTLRAKSAGA